MKHSLSLPVKIGYSDGSGANDDGRGYCITDANDSGVILSGDIYGIQDKDLAELIVRAVNNEQRYREALTTVRMIVHQYRNGCDLTVAQLCRDIDACALAALSEDAS